MTRRTWSSKTNSARSRHGGSSRARPQGYFEARHPPLCQVCKSPGAATEHIAIVDRQAALMNPAASKAWTDRGLCSCRS
eukprot:1677430-Pyramimonas_sp.AAC.1